MVLGARSTRRSLRDGQNRMLARRGPPSCGRFWLVLLLALLLMGCTERVGTPIPVATLMPTPTGPPPPTLAPSAVPVDSGWISLSPGMELRRLRVDVGTAGVASLRLLRLDPARLRFQVGYAPDAPRSITRWVEDYGALAAINGGFFDAQNQTVSLIVQDGQPLGESYNGRGGMFAVSADGTVRLWGLAERPYDPAEPLRTALQGWPLLVQPGGGIAYDFEDGERARRSALALDRAGRVLFIVAPSITFTLAEFAAWLAHSDLEIDAAVNMDGGSSSALLVRLPDTNERIDAFVPLPIVLLVLPKGA